MKKAQSYFRKSAGLSSPSVVLLCATGGAAHEKHHKGIMARKRHAARGRQTEHSRDETTEGVSTEALSREHL